MVEIEVRMSSIKKDCWSNKYIFFLNRSNYFIYIGESMQIIDTIKDYARQGFSTPQGTSKVKNHP